VAVAAAVADFPAVQVPPSVTAAVKQAISLGHAPRVAEAAGAISIAEAVTVVLVAANKRHGE
jgi:hypothetical protein